MGRELYVGNISYEASENDLWRLFSVAGTVSSIHLITDPQTGQFKGCGYVKMASIEEAKEAINSLDGALLNNRLITVSEAKPPKQREPRAVGSGRGRAGTPFGGKTGTASSGRPGTASGGKTETSAGKRPGTATRGKTGTAAAGKTGMDSRGKPGMDTRGKTGTGGRTRKGKKP
ncbi:MAG: RNA-binding protein [Desulfuromonadales bacterium]|nr:MAG: RNA-binding protein [Desulfuromonadales bacterium]